MSTANLHRVLVRLVCRSCRRDWDLCIAVEAFVPGPLRCNPGGGPAPGAGTSTGLACPACNCPCGLDVAGLRARVEEELRTGRGRHVQKGAVIIECR